MRLERQHQAAARECTTGCGQRGRHLDRVVTVIVDDGEAALAIGRGHIAITLKASAHALELGQCALHSGIIHTQLYSHRNGRQSVQHVVNTWQIQHDGHVGQCHPIAPLHREMHLPVLSLHVHRTHLGAFVQTIGGHRAGDVVHDGLHTGVVRADDGRAVKRHAVQELHKRGFELGQVMAIGFHVVGVDVGHHRHHGQEVQKRSIRLVGFHHDVVACAQLGIGACAVQAATNHKGGVQSSFGQNTGHQAGRGGFPVCARNGHALLHAHELGQHHSPRHDGDVTRPSGQHLGVVGFDSG